MSEKVWDEPTGGYSVHFCPECLEDRKFKDYYRSEDFKVGGKIDVEIIAHYLKCESCEELILDPKDIDENFT